MYSQRPRLRKDKLQNFRKGGGLSSKDEGLSTKHQAPRAKGMEEGRGKGSATATAARGKEIREGEETAAEPQSDPRSRMERPNPPPNLSHLFIRSSQTIKPSRIISISVSVSAPAGPTKDAKKSTVYIVCTEKHPSARTTAAFIASNSHREGSIEPREEVEKK